MSEIIHIERAKQLLLFDNMKRRWGLSPTDVEGVLIGKIRGLASYRGKVFIYMEAKVKGTSLPSGQQRCLEEICDSYYEEIEEKWKAKNFAWAIICEHNAPIEEDIMARHQYVSEIFSSITLAWHPPKHQDIVPKFELDDGKLTVLSAIEQIEQWCHDHNILIGKERED